MSRQIDSKQFSILTVLEAGKPEKEIRPGFYEHLSPFAQEVTDQLLGENKGGAHTTEAEEIASRIRRYVGTFETV